MRKYLNYILFGDRRLVFIVRSEVASIFRQNWNCVRAKIIIISNVLNFDPCLKTIYLMGYFGRFKHVYLIHSSMLPNRE